MENTSRGTKGVLDAFESLTQMLNTKYKFLFGFIIVLLIVVFAWAFIIIN